MTDLALPLPRTWFEESPQPALADAAEEVFGRRPAQDRDWPGNRGRGISPVLDRNGRRRQPVPEYGGAPRHVISYGQDGNDVEVIQITPTTMPPEAAKAYLTSLWADPRLPFVAAHTDPSVDLNGASGYFTVGGPVLAVPVHTVPAPPAVNPRAGGQGNHAETPVPVDLTALTPLDIEVSHAGGVEDADFAWAARHHVSLGPNDILTGALHLRGIKALDYSTSGQLPRGGEVLMVKLMGPEGNLGYFPDTAAAHAALVGVLASRQYRDLDDLEDFSEMQNFTAGYGIVPCLMKGGREITGILTTRLTAARATVYAQVTTVVPDPALPVTGWRMAWQTAGRHENSAWVEFDPGSGGPPLRRRDH